MSEVCEKCGQVVVRAGKFFWKLPLESNNSVSFCPEGDLHEVEEDEENES